MGGNYFKQSEQMWLTVLTESAFYVVVFSLGILWGEDGFLWEVGQKP